jgi:predicted nucleic acid-binding protein
VIVLGRLGVIDEVRDLLGTLHITAEVHAESTMAGRPGADAVEHAVGQGWITVLEPRQSPPVSGLGSGETATIRRALDAGMTAVIDDLDARRAAGRLGVKLTGTIALLVRLDELGAGLAISDAIDRLDEMGFRLSAAVRTWALAAGAQDATSRR